MKQSARSWRPLLLAAAVLAIATAAVAAAGCGGSGTSDAGAPPVPGDPGLTPVPMSAGTILGAGASFPAPLYMKWGSDYNGVSGVCLLYTSPSPRD